VKKYTIILYSTHAVVNLELWNVGEWKGRGRAILRRNNAFLCIVFTWLYDASSQHEGAICSLLEFAIAHYMRVCVTKSGTCTAADKVKAS